MVPRVSVLMPLYKPDPAYLSATVESIRTQSLTDWELIAIEDPPASEAGEILRSFNDSRIRHSVRATKRSLGDALNDGLALCSAPLVARMDADDIAVPERLATQLAYLASHPHTIVLGSSLTIIDARGRVVGHRRLPATFPAVAAAIRRHNPIAHPSVMFRRQAIIDAGGYDPAAKTEDYDLWCRLVKSGGRLENLAAELLQYRFHSGALKFEGVHEVIRATIATKEKYFRSEFTLRDRLRIVSEKVLLRLPPALVLRLFQFAEYRS